MKIDLGSPVFDTDIFQAFWDPVIDTIYCSSDPYAVIWDSVSETVRVGVSETVRVGVLNSICTSIDLRDFEKIDLGYSIRTTTLGEQS